MNIKSSINIAQNFTNALKRGMTNLNWQTKQVLSVKN